MNHIKFRLRLGGELHYWGFVNKGFGLSFMGMPTTNQESYSMEDLLERSPTLRFIIAVKDRRDEGNICP